MRNFVYLIIFISFFDLFSQLPIMSPYADSLNATPFVIGLVVGIYSFSNMFGNIISGFMTDKRGPFLILVFGLFAASISLLLYYAITDPISLLAVRFVHGFMEGLIVPAAFTFLANRTEGSKRGKNVAISGAFVGLAAIIGPAYGGIVAAKTSPAFVMAINGVLMFIIAIIAFFVLRTFKFVPKKKAPENQARVRHVRQLFRSPKMVRSFAGAFFLMFSQGVLALVLPLKVVALGFDAKSSGMLLSIFGITAVLIFLLPINRIFDHIRPIITLAFGMSMMGLSMLLLSQLEVLNYLYIAMILYGIGFAFLFPSINSLLIDASTPEFRGKAYGYFYGFFSIGTVAGSSVIGFLDLKFSGSFMLTGILLIVVALISLIGNTKKDSFDNAPSIR